MIAPRFETEALAPFGLVVRVPEGTDFSELPEVQLHAWLAEHRVIVVRGLRSFEKAEMPRQARRLGPLLAWPFGAINELVPSPDAKNYLYTNRDVPLHWDGAFVGKVPRYLFFHCLEAPNIRGGETVFVDTARVWKHADEATRDRWRALTFRYATDRVVHYGGAFEARVVASHPYTHETVLRFAEPVDDLNAVTVTARDLGPLDSARMITELRGALADERAVLLHAWQQGDVVIADNRALLHGRRAFDGGERRHIRRINVLGPERSWKDTVRDAVRIRRPEFMVAELPILLIPMLLARQGHVPWTTLVELSALFFLLFHFGDMINCLADRELDAVYKTSLSEAIYGLGTRNVSAQVAATALAALALAAHLGVRLARPDVVLLVVVGLLLGAQYSVGPLKLKSRGVLQVVTLWAVIFVGPMLLVARVVGGPLSAALGALVLAYGGMQEGIILVNTAEDLPEDRGAGIRTTAVQLGLSGCVRLSVGMVAGFGGAVLGLFGWMTAGAASSVVALLPLCAAWAWVVWEIGAVAAAVRGLDEPSAMVALRPRARRMPLWIAATAWASLWAAAWTVCAGSRP